MDAEKAQNPAAKKWWRQDSKSGPLEAKVCIFLCCVLSAQV